MLNFKKSLNFMGQRYVAMVLSLTLIVLAIGFIAVRGLNLGIDFTGGTGIEVGYPKPVELENLRKVLEEAGYQDASAQHVDGASHVIIRIPLQPGVDRSKLSDQIVSLLRAKTDPGVIVRSVDFVGPKVGDELREDGGMAMLIALSCILIYVGLRFEFRFAFGAIIALVHDVIITTGFFAATQVKFDLAVLAAILAVIGYSLNDTIVVYDRIRENFRRLRKETTEDVLNISINQTLSRTIVTSLTTLLVLFALYFYGGESLNGFSLALIIGIVVGTYSSIYVASTSLLFMNVSKADLMPVKKEGVEDGRP